MRCWVGMRARWHSKRCVRRCLILCAAAQRRCGDADSRYAIHGYLLAFSARRVNTARARIMRTLRNMANSARIGAAYAPQAWGIESTASTSIGKQQSSGQRSCAFLLRHMDVSFARLVYHAAHTLPFYRVCGCAFWARHCNAHARFHSTTLCLLRAVRARTAAHARKDFLLQARSLPLLRVPIKQRCAAACAEQHKRTRS